MIEGQLFVAGEEVACHNSALLAEKGITHAINCASHILPSPFKSQMTYLELQLNDDPSQTLLPAITQANTFIRQALSSPSSRVLIYCHEGVSRSVSLCIGYCCSLNPSVPIDTLLADIKEKRKIANPNLGFMTQLMQYREKLIAGDINVNEEEEEEGGGGEEEKVDSGNQDDKDEAQTDSSATLAKPSLSFYILDTTMSSSSSNEELDENGWISLGVVDDQDLQPSSALLMLFPHTDASAPIAIRGWLWLGEETSLSASVVPFDEGRHGEVQIELPRSIPVDVSELPLYHISDVNSLPSSIFATQEPSLDSLGSEKCVWFVEREGEESNAFWDLFDTL